MFALVKSFQSQEKHVRCTLDALYFINYDIFTLGKHRYKKEKNHLDVSRPLEQAFRNTDPKLALTTHHSHGVIVVEYLLAR